MKGGKMRAIWTGLTAVLLALGVDAAPIRADSLADALIKAYRNSNLLEQNQAILRAADEDEAVALANLRPVLSFVGRGGWDKADVQSIFLRDSTVEQGTGSLGLSVDLVIWAGGRGKLAVQVARESVLATREALVSVEQQVLLSAVSAYVDVRLQAESVSLSQSSVRLISQELQAAQDRFDVGEVTRTDVAIANSRLAAAQAGLAAAIGAQSVAREAYKAAIGEYPGKLTDKPRPPITAKSLEAARSVAVRTHPEILRAQRNATVADLQVQIAKADYSPTLAAQANTNLNTATGGKSSAVFLDLRQQLYTGGAVSALYRRALAGKAAADAALHQTVLLVDENLGSAWSNVLVAEASITAGQLQIDAARTAYEGVREEATLGVRTTLEVLDAEQELLDAFLAKLQAEADRYVFTYQVLSAMGLLTAEHLKLGVPTYDPEAYYNAVKNAPLSSTQGKALDRILNKIAN